VKEGEERNQGRMCPFNFQTVVALLQSGDPNLVKFTLYGKFFPASLVLARKPQVFEKF
jgi:hypothetical protein